MVIFKLLFPKRHEQLQQLLRDNEELKGICLEQISQIQKLEDDCYELDYKLEDTELELENTKYKLEDAEYAVGELESEIADLQYKLQNREEF